MTRCHVTETFQIFNYFVGYSARRKRGLSSIFIHSSIDSGVNHCNTVKAIRLRRS